MKANKIPKKKKKACQAKKRKGRSRQKLEPKNKFKKKGRKACQAVNPKGRSRQKLEQKTKRKKSLLG